MSFIIRKIFEIVSEVVHFWHFHFKHEIIIVIFVQYVDV